MHEGEQNLETAPKFERLRNGKVVKLEELFRGTFSLREDKKNVWPTTTIVVTNEELFLFKSASGPEGWDKNSQAADSFNSGTAACTRLPDLDICQGLDDCVCTMITGCANDKCNGGHKHWEVCGPASDVQHLEESIDNAYLSINKIQERLAPSIAVSVEGILRYEAKDDGKSVPDNFSPFVLSWLPNVVYNASITATMAASGVAQKLRNISASFQKGVIPYRPGKNSRSGAAFFFSGDRAYICKRIRDFERESLWHFVKDGEYARRLQARSSVLNAVYTSFISAGAPWIVMEAEALPAGLKGSIPENERTVSFFEDLKPAPLTSDRKKFTKILAKVRAEKDLILEDMPGWSHIKHLVESDAQFLMDKNFVDYSLLVHGKFFEKPSSVPDDWEETMAKEAKKKTGCVFGCSSKPARRLVDVTKLILPYGTRNGAVPIKEGKYICCCRNFHKGDSLNILSPCMLTKTKMIGQVFPMPETCENLLDYNWASYVSDNTITDNRCLLPAGVLPTNVSAATEEEMPLFLGPEAAFGVVPEAPTQCGAVCVSGLDYLLPLNAWNSFENALLLPVYGSFKWSDYKGKILDMMSCISTPPAMASPEFMETNWEAQAMSRWSVLKKFQGPAQLDACVKTDLDDLMGSGSTAGQADKQMLDHLIVESTSLKKANSAEFCSPDEGIFPMNCAIDPDDTGHGWLTQMKQQRCHGNMMLIRLSSNSLIGLRVLATPSWTRGHFEYVSPFSDDVDLQSFNSTQVTRVVNDDGSEEIQIFNKEYDGHYERPLDFALWGANKQFKVLYHTAVLRIFESAKGTVGYNQEGGMKVTEEESLWSFLGLSSHKKATKVPDTLGTLPELTSQNLYECKEVNSQPSR